MSTRRVLVVDDHALILATTRLLVEKIEGFEVVAESSSGRDAIRLAKEHRPDLIIMDISMPGLNGIYVTSHIRSEVPEARILILSSHTSEEMVQGAMRAGASGYVVKDGVQQELGPAIHALMSGERYLSASVSQHLA